MLRGFRCKNGHTATMETEIQGLPCPDCREPLNTDPMVKGGDLDSFAWPGGYPILWIADIDTSNCATLCAECAAKGRDSGDIQTLTPDVYYEGPPEHCEDCGKEMESAYGDPDSEDSE